MTDLRSHDSSERLGRRGGSIRLNGVPILLNTSFNVMGKPMVHSVQDAMAVLMTTGLDAVMFDSILVEKQGKSLPRSSRDEQKDCR